MNKTNKKHSFAVVAVLMIITAVGISLAWFYQHAAMSTLMNIVPPDSISIVPVDGDGNDSSMLDLDFKEGIDSKDNNTGKITIYRPMYVYSTSPVHQLEIAHTTNMNELSFAIYPATLNEDKSYSYDKNNRLSGEYKNKDNNTSLAEQNNLNNYKAGDTVEKHAYPLYWLAGNSGDGRYVIDADKSKINQAVVSKTEKKFDPAKQVDKTYYKTYYIIEISWLENSKETDLFYVMAQNCAVTANEGS